MKILAEARLSYMTLEMYLKEREMQGREEGRKEGREEGRQEGIEQVALTMISRGKSFGEISDLTEIPIQRLKALAENLN